MIQDDVLVCDCQMIHPEVVERVKNGMISDSESAKLADFFKVFGDATRIRILFALQQQEMCVCDLAAILDMTQSAISHQLRILKMNFLVKNRRNGKVIYYSLDDSHIAEIFTTALAHQHEDMSRDI